MTAEGLRVSCRGSAGQLLGRNATGLPRDRGAARLSFDIERAGAHQDRVAARPGIRNAIENESRADATSAVDVEKAMQTAPRALNRFGKRSGPYVGLDAHRRDLRECSSDVETAPIKRRCTGDRTFAVDELADPDPDGSDGTTAGGLGGERDAVGQHGGTATPRLGRDEGPAIDRSGRRREERRGDLCRADVDPDNSGSYRHAGATPKIAFAIPPPML